MTTPQPGTFLFSTADLGNTLVTSLFARTDPAADLYDLVEAISTCTSLFMESGKRMNIHHEYFKPSFQTTFDPVVAQVRECFSDLKLALEIIDLYKCGKQSFGVKGGILWKPSSGLRERVLWALELKKGDWSVVEERVEGCFGKAWMLSQLVSLVIVQKTAQGRDLTIAEKATLRSCKDFMPKILTELRKCELGSLMAFRLTGDTEEVLNATQISEQAKQNIEANEGSETATLSGSLDDLKLSSTNSIKKPPIPAPVVASTPVWPPPQPPKDYEIYRLTKHHISQRSVTKTISILPFHSNETHVNTSYHIARLPASKPQIAEFMRVNTRTLPGVDDLLTLPPYVTTAVGDIIKTKITSHVYMADKWEIHAVIPRVLLPPRSSPVGGFRGLFKKPKKEKEVEYVIILSLQQPGRGVGPPPPPPPAWKQSKKFGKGYIADTEPKCGSLEFKLSSREVEDVVNGFLAGVTSLYDGVNVEDRGRALRDAEWYFDVERLDEIIPQ
ncbi:hypothetical protein M7I_1157 [Glarea lozoyensis 74030]|uniref:Uncharacterized protein n=1 Tax=Glarea lozoyensis (strain ATCC 74030 / MF5533) TaxID=1104152 RepID=H0EFM8_GLAL7|nr:hypothetical protein M7I_1157 [Glarea lozoyensis 74030]